jgi:D-glycero-D-manno-heptose 1,7-bisphosphate phosphatase
VSGRRAVFLDRDGTIIEDAGYLRDPAAVRLLAGAAGAIARLNQHGLIVVVVTNQSGIARGLLTLAEYRSTERRVDELLTLQGARLDAHYFCPHLPELSGPCDCRKPGSLLYRQAAQRFAIDLSESWWVGDRLRDVLPAQSFGARGILLLTRVGESEASDERAGGFERVSDLAAAVDVILGSP